MLCLAISSHHQRAPAAPGGQGGEGDEAHGEREPAAFGNLDDVGGEEGDVDRQQRAGTSATSGLFQRQISTMTKATRMVSISMVPVTAMP